MTQILATSILLLLALCSRASARGPAFAEEAATSPARTVSQAVVRDGITIHTVETPYQNGRQEIHVLLPDHYRADGAYPVLYVLPVEKGFGRKYGYGLGVLKRMNAHNRYDLIVVQMGFEKEPWFADHATDPETRQASYVKEFVVPFIETGYATLGRPEGRLLFGFSKSGWGAFSLILTYPEFFGYAASWDAPMFLSKLHYRMEPVYGTLEQLNAYRPDLLVSRRKKYFQKKTRLVLTGERDWGQSIPAPRGGSHTVEMHTLLEHEGIKHIYDNRLDAPHRWDASWMAPTLEALMTLTKTEQSAAAGGGDGVRQTRWDFNDLNEWQDDSQGDSPRSYAIRDGVLRIATRPQSRDRVKVRTTARFGAGTYTWRVYVPEMGKGDQASIGAFLYRDDRHEVDFEIGYGKASVRTALNAGDTDLVCYCTSQGHPASSSQLLVESEAWHTLAIEVGYGKDGNYRIEWLVDDKPVKQLQTSLGDEIAFTVHCSVENLLFIGDHLPTRENYALFDYVEFAAIRAGHR